jgi:hypothetical protein
MQNPQGDIKLAALLVKRRSINVRFSPKATELPRGSEMTRWAISRHPAEISADCEARHRPAA